MSYTAMQAWQLANFGKKTYFMNSDGDLLDQAVNIGCMGCGKTYNIMESFGYYLLSLKELGYKDLKYVLIGKTYNAIKKNMLNVLSKLYGSDFRYDHSTKEGMVCDARLFGFPLFFIPLNDSQAETRIRGLSDITGAILDEHVLIPEEQYVLILSRIRGGADLPPEYMNNWLISSTNPDSPSHWLLKNYIQKGLIKVIQWRHRDAGWNGFHLYMERIKRTYRHMPAFYERYVLGRWKAAEGLVFSAFNAKMNVVEGNIDYNYVLRSWISVDYGSNHKTSVQVHHMLTTGIRVVSQNVTFTRTSVSAICRRIASLLDEQRAYNSNKTINIYVDSAAQSIIDELREMQIDALNAKKDVIPGNTYVNEQFDSCMLIILLNEGTQELIDEIYGYKYKTAPNAKDGEVVKIDDDCCDALRYGVYSDAKYNNAY